MLKGVLASKKGKVRAAHFQPLTQLELVAVHRNSGNLERIKEAKVLYPYQSLHTDFVKSSMALFLAEVLANALLEETADPGLFDFLQTALLWLDTHDSIANFHLGFLLELTKYLGFYPDDSGAHLDYFDLLSGGFVAKPSLNPMLDGEILGVFKALLGTNFDVVHQVKLRKEQRQELLRRLLLYFELHLHGFRKPKSLEVLQDVFEHYI
jgi:DNA repair protein RecO (recombination protein O)